jgi:hypothetical protein
MRRIAFSALVALCLVALPASATAAPKAGCAAEASGWSLTSPSAAAEAFFPHLLPGFFADPAEFAALLDTVDRNGDDLVCTKLSWGYELNPNAHWYRVGFELGLDEPLHLLTTLDNNGNAS